MELLATAPTSLTIALFVLSNTLFPLLVVNAPFLLVRESLVSVGNFLELLFGSIGVILVLIRMVLDGELFERLLYFLFGRVFLDTQKLVVVFSLRFLLLMSLLLTTSSGN